eukprot:SAG31_NODE_1184_length_9496_cov_7.198680_6_plen_299_part_00
MHRGSNSDSGQPLLAQHFTSSGAPGTVPIRDGAVGMEPTPYTGQVLSTARHGALHRGSSLSIQAQRNHQIPLLRAARSLDVVAAQQRTAATVALVTRATRDAINAAVPPGQCSMVVCVKRLGATAFVRVDAEETPAQLVQRLRRQPPQGKPWEPLLLRLNRARVTRGPYVLEEHVPFVQQGITDCPVPVELALVFQSKSDGVGDLKETPSEQDVEDGQQDLSAGFPLVAKDENGEDIDAGIVDSTTSQEEWFRSLLAEQASRRHELEAEALRLEASRQVLHLKGLARTNKRKKKGKKK